MTAKWVASAGQSTASIAASTDMHTVYEEDVPRAGATTGQAVVLKSDGTLGFATRVEGGVGTGGGITKIEVVANQAAYDASAKNANTLYLQLV